MIKTTTKRCSKHQKDTDEDRTIQKIRVFTNNRRTSPLIWSLKGEKQIRAIQKMGHMVVPYLMEIKTAKLANIKNVSTQILKKQHYACCSGKKRLTVKYDVDEAKILNEMGIRYRIIKYIINFNYGD